MYLSLRRPALIRCVYGLSLRCFAERALVTLQGRWLTEVVKASFPAFGGYIQVRIRELQTSLQLHTHIACTNLTWKWVCKVGEHAKVRLKDKKGARFRRRETTDKNEPWEAGNC